MRSIGATGMAAYFCRGSIRKRHARKNRACPQFSNATLASGINEHVVFVRDIIMVGAAGFELATSCSQNMRANQAALRPESEDALLFYRVYANQSILLSYWSK